MALVRKGPPTILIQIFAVAVVPRASSRWPSSGSNAPAILPQILGVAVDPQALSRGSRQGGTQWRSSPKYLLPPSPEPCRVALVREGHAGNPPPNIRHVSLVRDRCAGESPPNIRGGSRPPSLVAWPSSGRGAVAILPQIFALAVIPRASLRGPRQEGTRRRSSPKYSFIRFGSRPPSLVAYPLSGRDSLAIFPQIFAVSVVPRASSRGPRQERTRRRSFPKYSRWTWSPQPRRVVLVREGRSGDPPPNIRLGNCPPGLVTCPSSGRGMPAILSQIFAVAVTPAIFAGPRQGGTRRQSFPK